MIERHPSITIIGKTNWRNSKQVFGIWDNDRLGHIYLVGKTGVGKSTLLLNMLVSDMTKDKGCAIIDPHSDLAEKLLEYVPIGRIEDVIYFNPGDADFPVGFNPIGRVHHSQYSLIVSGLIEAFKKVFHQSWGPRMEHILRFSLLTLVEFQDSTLLDLQPLLTDKLFRERVLYRCKTEAVLKFWYNEFDKYPPALRAEAIAPILNKISIFSANPLLRNIVGQRKSSFNLLKVLDEGKILICNLSKATLGEDASMLLGCMLISSVQHAALMRAKYPPEHRRPFFLYIDEVQSFATLGLASILSEARKYGLSLCLANQYVFQLDEPIRKAVFGNVGTMISFRVGSEDAKFLEEEFYPEFRRTDLINLPKHSVYLKIMIDGATSKPFSADMLPSLQIKAHAKEQIILRCRKNLAQKPLMQREIVYRSYDRQQKLPF
jgi:hypothetical protein